MISRDVLVRQRTKDEQLLRALADAGSDLTKAHSLEHHFVCPNRAAAQPIIAWGEAEGYQASVVDDGEYEGRKYSYFDLVMSTVPTISTITAQTTGMLEIAAKHGVEYDGWGCEAVN